MSNKNTVSLDDATIVKLAVAISKVSELVAANDDVPGPMVRKVLEALAEVEKTNAFKELA